MIDICEELKQNFVDFSYEANSQRAFPDARDGLKPGQRACLWEMYSKGYSSNKPHVKSAKVSGGVISSWWPHGDVAIYETFARMSQPWINNIPEVDWHGNNGNIVIGNEIASSRYTECRLSKATEEGMFCGIKKNNVPMKLNFTEDQEWPEVLPAIMPRLLINGSQGIGSTIANTWLPMNLKECAEVIRTYARTGQLDISAGLIDFPSGGIIVNKDDLHTIHETGKGKVVLRAKTEIKGKHILITELPYQVYIEELITKIKELVEKDELKGIADVINKTDKSKILIDVECEADPEKVLSNLFSLTDLQSSYNANQFALVSKTPKLLTLQEYIDIYLSHNKSCIRKEYENELTKATERLEIVSGLAVALAHIDDIVAIIKKSTNSAAAIDTLKAVYDFTDNQAKAIVAMRLGSLARLEGVELNKEKETLEGNIAHFRAILSDDSQILDLVLERLQSYVAKFGVSRRTELAQVVLSGKTGRGKIVEKEIEPEKVVVVMTQSGLIKRIPATSYRLSTRNTKGMKTQDDITSHIIRTNTIDSLMIFSNKGRIYRLSVNDIPEGDNTSRGQAIRNLVEFSKDETPTIIYSLYKNTDAKYVIFTTKNGLVKKTSIEEYNSTKRKCGMDAIKFRENDELASVALISEEDFMIITAKGKAIRFKSTEVSPTGRNTSGVKGINLDADDKVIAGMPIRNPNDYLALFSENGYGKKVPLSEFVSQGRAGKGILCYKPTADTGEVVSSTFVEDTDKVLIMGQSNSLCLAGKDISTGSRSSLGTLVISKNKIKTVSKV